MISIQALREKAHSLMTNGMRNSPGLFDRRNDKLNRTLPVYLAEPNDRQSRQELPHRINQWIDEKKGLIAQLSAPLGQGKTIATCTLQRQLQRIYPDKVCVWIAMRDILNIDVFHADRLILKLLGFDGDARLEREDLHPSEIFSCVILDGIDEFLTTGSGNSSQETLVKILRVLCEIRVPVLLSGRDIALESSPLHSHLRGTLDSLRNKYFRPHPILKLQLQTWEDTVELRQILKGRISDALTDRQDNNLILADRQQLIADRIDRIRSGVLQSPLLFGLAHETLVQQIDRVQFIDYYIDGRALNLNSEFNQAIDYWVKHRYPPKLNSEVDLPSLLDVGSVALFDDPENLKKRRIIGAIACILAALRDPNNIPQNQNTIIRSPEQSYNFIPKGRYFIWGQDSNGDRIPELVEIPVSILLGEKFVTIEEYARFLTANPAIALPNQPDALWSRSNINEISYLDNMADLPVKGISFQEAQYYCAWLSGNEATEVVIIAEQNFMPQSVQIPDPIVLKVAGAGTDLRNPSWQEPGAFGTQDLFCNTWQLTSDSNLVFGGSKELGGTTDPTNADRLDDTMTRDRAQKVYESAYPQGTRQLNSDSKESTVGFRVCRPLIEIKNKVIGEGLASVSSPPPGDPPGDPDSIQPIDLTPEDLDEIATRLSQILPLEDRSTQELLERLNLGEEFSRTSKSFAFWGEVINQNSSPEAIKILLVNIIDCCQDRILKNRLIEVYNNFFSSGN